MVGPMKTKLFQRLDEIGQEPFLDVADAAVFLKCTKSNIRKQISGGCYCAIKAGGLKIVSNSFVAWMISQLWEMSLDGKNLVGIDMTELEVMHEKYL